MGLFQLSQATLFVLSVCLCMSVCMSVSVCVCMYVLIQTSVTYYHRMTVVGSAFWMAPEMLNGKQ